MANNFSAIFSLFGITVPPSFSVSSSLLWAARLLFAIDGAFFFGIGLTYLFAPSVPVNNYFGGFIHKLLHVNRDALPFMRVVFRAFGCCDAMWGLLLLFASPFANISRLLPIALLHIVSVGALCWQFVIGNVSLLGLSTIGLMKALVVHGFFAIASSGVLFMGARAIRQQHKTNITQ